MQIKRGALVATGLFALIPLSTGGPRLPRVVEFSGPTAPSAPVAYSTKAKEFYMTADEIGYIRPGFHITVNSITIPRGPASGRGPLLHRRPEPAARPAAARSRPARSRSARCSPGGTRERGTTPRTRRRSQTSPITNVTATQAAADSGGTWTDLEIGHSTYTFKTALPAGYDDSKTHTLGDLRDAQHDGHRRTRTTTTTSSTTSGRTAGPVTEIWDKTHERQLQRLPRPARRARRLASGRQALRHSATSPQTIDPDTGNTVDLRVMIHKIHRGENLPSVEAGTPYVIIGNRQSSTTTRHVVFPKDIRNCTTCHEAGRRTQYTN